MTRMEAFVAEAKDRFAAIEARLERIEGRLDRLQGEMILSTRWIIGTMLAVSTVSIGIITFVINSGGGRTTPAASAAVQPIVIYVQPAAGGNQQ